MKNIKGIVVCLAMFVPPIVMFLSVTGPIDAVFSQLLGSSALIAMALSQIMATRARFVEPIFGPLDQAYVLHKWLGICALVALLLHENIDAEIKALGEGTWISEWGEDLGELGFNGLIALIAITLLTFIPYRIWYWTHRAMGICFVLGAIHFATAIKPFSNFDPLGLYVLGFCVLGALSYIYTLIPRSWRRGFEYTVTKVERTGSATAITLRPTGRPLRHRAGQFAFFTFQRMGLGETHPFTISSAPHDDGTLRISVAALGDYTKRLSQKIEVGMTLHVQGPYGRFTFPRGSKRQVWIAGGVGITPFLSWLEALDQEGPQIDLIYTYRGVQNAPHLADVEKLAGESARVNLHLFDTVTGPRVSTGVVANIVNGQKVRYAFCGPAILRDTLRASIGWRKFHAEAFEIRTGLPIPKMIRGWFNKQYEIRKPNWAR